MGYTAELEAVMRFTVTMFGGSFALMLIAYNLFGGGILTTIGALWFLVSIPMVSYYWITRVVRRAWRDGQKRDADAT